MIFQERQIHAAIFNMDGTLFDTERLRFSTLKQASTQIFGQPISDAVLTDSLGLSARKAEALARQHYGPDYPYSAIRQRADELELAYVRKYGVPLKPGLFEVLEHLKAAGLLLAVATSSRRAIAEEYLINAGVMKYFDITVCGDEVARGKPHPEIFLTASASLNCEPQHCLSFEDSENGIRSAAAAGTLVIAIRDIKEPCAEVRALAFRYCQCMTDFLADLRPCLPSRPVPRLTDPFPATRNDLKVGIHGFGAMGGGYLAQVLAHWDGYTRPQEIVGATSDQALRNLVNAFGRYAVHYANRAFEQAIEHVRLIDINDPHAMQELYRETALVAICLPENAIRQQAGQIARGLQARFAGDAEPLTLLVVLNKLGGAAFTRRCVRDELLRQMDADEADALLARVEFSETVVNRIVSKTPRELLRKQLRLRLHELRRLEDSLGELHLTSPRTASEESLQQLSTRLGHLAPLSELGSHSLSLFSSGPDMPLYAQKGGALLERLCQVQTVDDIAAIQKLKNRLLNGTHAIIAWYASLLGYPSIGQGMGDERVQQLARQVVDREIKPALLRENPALAPFADRFIDNFLQRCRRSFKDPCQRVARDPLRKLQRRERILGSIDLARQFGLTTERLEFATALALLYALRCAPPEDKECQLIRSLYERHGTAAAVLTYDGNYLGAPYPGLDAQTDAALLARIDRHFEALAAEGSSHWDWPLQEA